MSLDIRQCVFCPKLFTMPHGGVSGTAYDDGRTRGVCNACKKQALEEAPPNTVMQVDPVHSNAFSEAWQNLEKQDRHENHPDYSLEDPDWERHEAEYGPDVDQNVMNIPGMVGLLEDLQQYSGNCLDSIDERLAVAEGLLAMGWSKSSPMRGLPE